MHWIKSHYMLLDWVIELLRHNQGTPKECVVVGRVGILLLSIFPLKLVEGGWTFCSRPKIMLFNEGILPISMSMLNQWRTWKLQKDALRKQMIKLRRIRTQEGSEENIREEALLGASYHGRARLAELLMAPDLILPHIAAHALTTTCCIGFVDVMDTLMNCGRSLLSVYCYRPLPE